jgi:hypothetical protein
LAGATTYYWQLRANNADGTTYANGSSNAFWSFTTAVNPPAAFNKTSPGNGAVNQSTSPSLNWSVSSGAISYDYCYDTSNDNTCSNWTSSGSATSITLDGLADATTYYWQVRANNAGGTVWADWGSWWSFSTSSQKPYLSFLPVILRSQK